MLRCGSDGAEAGVDGGFGDGRRGKRGCFPKRDSQGSGPLSGCGQSPPCRQCRRPVPLAAYSRAQAPRAGGLGASFLFRRQNAYTADGPRAGAVCLRRLERRDGGGMRLRREGRKVGILRARKGGKRGKVGLDRRPAPNVRREKWGNETYPATPSPGAPGKFPDGQNAPTPCFFRDTPKYGAPLCSAFARRANSVEYAPRQRPLPVGQGSGRKEVATSFSRVRCVSATGWHAAAKETQT